MSADGMAWSPPPSHAGSGHGPISTSLLLPCMQPLSPGLAIAQPQKAPQSQPSRQQHGLLALPNDVLAKIADNALRCGSGTALTAACRDLRDATQAALHASPCLRLKLVRVRLHAMYGAYGSDCVTADGIYSCSGARRLLLPDHLSESQRVEVLLALVEELTASVAEAGEQGVGGMEGVEAEEQGGPGWRQHELQQMAAAGGCGGERQGVALEGHMSELGAHHALGVGDQRLQDERACGTFRGRRHCCARVREQVQELIVAAARAGDTRSVTGLMQVVWC